MLVGESSSRVSLKGRVVAGRRPELTGMHPTSVGLSSPHLIVTSVFRGGRNLAGSI